MAERVNCRFRTVLRNHARRIAAFSEDRNRSHRQVLSGMRDRLANSLRDGKRPALTAAWRRKFGHVALGLDHDTGHDDNCLARMFSAGGFRREHHGIGTVENGICHVARLCTSGSRVLDHRLEHLGGGNYRLPPRRGPSDNVLLNDRNFLRRHFYSKISTGDHHPVGSLEDFLQLL